MQEITPEVVSILVSIVKESLLDSLLKLVVTSYFETIEWFTFLPAYLLLVITSSIEDSFRGTKTACALVF